MDFILARETLRKSGIRNLVFCQRADQRGTTTGENRFGTWKVEEAHYAVFFRSRNFGHSTMRFTHQITSFDTTSAGFSAINLRSF
jgi:hypothetical protein